MQKTDQGPGNARNNAILLAGGLLLVLLAVIAVYWPGLSGSFIFDDTPNIVNRTAVQMESLDKESIESALGAYRNQLLGRPLATISLALDWYVWDGDPRGFKKTNLAIHSVNVTLIFVLALQLFRMDRSGRNWPAWAALGLAVIWAIHPLQVSTVLYIVQRMEMMAVTFTLLALLAYLRGRHQLLDGSRRGWLWISGAGALACLAFLGKEIGILFVAFALCLELVLFGFRAREKVDRTLLIAGYGTIIIFVVGVFLLVMLPEYTDPSRYIIRVFTWDERLLSQLRILPMYLGQMVFPVPAQMTFYYDNFSPSTGLLSPPTTLLGGLVIAVLLGAAWLVRKSAPLAALGILWFFCAHLLTSNIIPLELAFEHRNYFALFGVLLAITALLRLLTGKRFRLPAPALVVVLILGLGSINAIRSATWGEPLPLAMHHATINPTSERARLDLAEIYLEMSDGISTSPFLLFARNEFERIENFDHSSPIASQALILIDVQLGQEIGSSRRDRYLEKLRTYPPSRSLLDSFVNLVGQRFAGTAVPDALIIDAYEELHSRDGIPPPVHTRFAYLALETFGEDALAMRAFNRAVEVMDDRDAELPGLIRSLQARGHDEIAAQLTPR